MKDIILQQQIASNSKNSAWVFASAGSGKTRILINRLLRLLLSEVMPSKILCLTFTKNAAGEMESRIQESLAKWIKYDDNELIEEIKNLDSIVLKKEELPKIRSVFFKMIDQNIRIKVMTIHSFCQSLLKIFPFEAKISPNFEILEEASKKILIQKSTQIAIKQVLNNGYAFKKVNKIFQNYSQGEVIEAIENIIKNKEDFQILKDHFFDIKNIVNQIYSKFSIESNFEVDTFLQKFKFEAIKNDIKVLQKNLSQSKLVKDEQLVKTSNLFLKNPNFDNFNKYKEIFINKDNIIKKPSSTISKDVNLLNIYNIQANIINLFEDKIKSYKICEENSSILYLVNQILDIFNKLKSKDALLDYQDLIVITNSILQNSEFANWIKMKVDSTYEHILVDESQDTNLKQWQIINSLTEDFFAGIGASNNNRSLFVVGDEKQSIYSFQGAQADISSRIYEYYKSKTNDIKRLDLNNSFRSAINILKAVDNIFCNPKFGSAISKSNVYQRHNSIRSYLGKFEIWPQIVNDNNNNLHQQTNDLDSTFQIDAKEKLARYIAITIKHDIISRKILPDKNRQVTFGDYMILLRKKTNGFDKELIKYFKKFNIPFSSQSRLKFSDSLVIQDFLSIAIFITSPFDNLNLCCLLKSPIFGLADCDLLEIINYDKGSDILNNLQYSTKYDAEYQVLLYLINLSQKFSVYEFYYFVLNQHYFRQSYLNYFGNQIDEIIDKFLNILYNFSKNNSSDFQKFLEFVKLADPEISLKSLGEDSVKILTIHSAKGLQAPIVFMPDCCFNLNKQKKDSVLWLNGNFNFPIWCAKKNLQNSILQNHSLDLWRETNEENLRLLYVAMTRAEDELYVAGFGDEKNPESWYNIVKDSSPDNYLPNIYNEIDLLAADISRNNDQKLEETKNSYKILLPKDFNISCNLNEDINFGQIYGTFIHRLIDFLIKNRFYSKPWLKDNSIKIINNIKVFDNFQKNRLISKVSIFLDGEFFNSLKGKIIKSEYEIASNGNIYRIDLAIVEENKLTIIDYKSEQKIPKKLPIKYKNQLENYKRIIADLYPTKNIECSIFWLEQEKLQKVC